MRFFSVILLFALVFLIHGKAHADCENPPASTGTIIFNPLHNVFQGCLAAGQWVAFHDKPGGGPQVEACETGPPGTDCSDGSFYIGQLEGGPRLYAAEADESGTFQWKDANSGTNDPSSLTDGYSNTYSTAMNTGTHPARNACATKHPAGTWYLPAYDELNEIWENRASINLTAKGFTVASDAFYWSSSEIYTNNAWYQRFSDLFQFYGTKTTSNRVRCVRH